MIPNHLHRIRTLQSNEAIFIAGWRSTRMFTRSFASARGGIDVDDGVLGIVGLVVAMRVVHCDLAVDDDGCRDTQEEANDTREEDKAQGVPFHDRQL